MVRLLVIGSASFDVLHLEDRTVSCAGGAGMYTAMAARRSGAQVALFGPRSEPCPERLKPVARYLTEWLGPVVPPAQLPRFEISYRQGKTEYLKASLDAEVMLSPTILPADLSTYDLIHVTPLGDATTQLPFIRACRQRGAKRISAGTGLVNAEEQPQAVRAVLEETDYFFLNDLEAKALFGSHGSAHAEPGKVLYVTLGAQGACIVQGDCSTFIPAVPATVMDPTGAGDTFCGATLAYLLQNNHPIMAARHAVTLAAEMIGQVGPSALLSEDPPPERSPDARVQVNDGRVRVVAEKIATIAEVSPFPFVSPEVPPVGHKTRRENDATFFRVNYWCCRVGGFDWGVRNLNRPGPHFA